MCLGGWKVTSKAKIKGFFWYFFSLLCVLAHCVVGQSVQKSISKSSEEEVREKVFMSKKIKLWFQWTAHPYILITDICGAIGILLFIDIYEILYSGPSTLSKWVLCSFFVKKSNIELRCCCCWTFMHIRGYYHSSMWWWIAGTR